MSKIENSYASYYNTVQQKNSKDVKSNNTKEMAASSRTSKTEQPKLSKAAQSMLDKLKKKYSNMDFMVSDFKNSNEAKQILSRGTKEFSVLFSTEELEKMASDEKYEKEYISRIDGALNMSEQINKQFGLKSNDDNVELVKTGVAFNKDGTMTYFAELEKASEKQKERIENTKQKRAEERKAEKQDKENAYRTEPVSVKRTSVQASSADELIKKINEIDWSKIKEENNTEGSRFDYSI